MIRGDTESFNCNYKFRMDLRLLCRSLNKSYDYCNGELARIINDMKYYDDKKKFVLNGIIQLDIILQSYEGDCHALTCQ